MSLLVPNEGLKLSRKYAAYNLKWISQYKNIDATQKMKGCDGNITSHTNTMARNEFGFFSFVFFSYARIALMANFRQCNAWCAYNVWRPETDLSRHVFRHRFYHFSLLLMLTQISSCPQTPIIFSMLSESEQKTFVDQWKWLQINFFLRII